MRLIKPIILSSISIAVFLLEGIMMISADEPSLSKADEVLIAPNSIGMPLGTILLIRESGNYGAVKFTKCWTGKTDYDQHAEYESYYQGDKTGDFGKSNVKHRKEEVYYKKPSFSIFGHPISIGDKRDIRCGPIELWWSGLKCVTTVYFNRHDQKQGDYYGIELAPTPWTDISQVNVFDPRIRWYKYDENRKDVSILVDRLWDDKEGSR
ncbi:MAG: hypothetical protein C3F12_11105 [Candidatus Methylomirabilota bacterium]|nr:hypothetical protein [candidate division NC10 bacterium]PWB44248.1 MAG: hypothetical protein C3F12_11105 [candidate division NC10 bacterium]